MRKLLTSLRPSRRVALALKLLITAAVCWILYRKLDWARLEQVWSEADLWLLFPALLAIAASKLASVPRLELHLAAAGCRIGFGENARLYLAGMYYSLFLPGGIGGDGYKAYWLRNRYQLPLRDLALALFLDRLSGLIGLGIWTLALFFMSDLPEQLLLTAGMLPFLSAAVLDVGLWLKSLLWSLVVQGLQLLGALLILEALHVSAERLIYLLVFLASSVVSSLAPFTIGGVGSRELVFAYAADFLPLSGDVSVLLAFLFFLLSALFSLTGVYYVFRSDRIADKSTP